MSAAATCDHCGLPLGRFGQVREVEGEDRSFCCYGCRLAFQALHGEGDEPQAAGLLMHLGVGGFLAMNVMLGSWLLYADAFAAEPRLGRLMPWLLWLLATPVLVILGAPFLSGAWQAARARRLGADALVVLGTSAAYAYSAWQVLGGSEQVYFDTATMVLMLFTLGRYLEAQGRAAATRSLAPLLAAEHAQARVVGDDAETLRPVADVRPGDTVRILPGERIAVDGRVIEGRSHCDESFLTGQPQPIAKAPGAAIHAGCLNGNGQLLVRASGDGNDSRWLRVGRLVRTALAEKSLLAQSADRAAAVFVPAVLLLALTTFAYWLDRADMAAALPASLAVLVVACPCALGLAAPLATALGLARAAERGILVRGGGVFEKLAGLRGIAFDKTGTLTAGRPQVLAVMAAATDEAPALARAKALARGSDHPIACAIAALGPMVAPAAAIQAWAGAGIAGEVDGVACALGSRAFMTAQGLRVPPHLRRPGNEAAGTSAVFVGWDGRTRARFVLADAVRLEAPAVIAALHRRGLATLILSGDAPRPVAQTAAGLGIPEWHAALRPEDKVHTLRRWATRHGNVAAVGDGLNDGLLLAAADVGIAVGAAADLARASADAVLPPDGLASLPWLFDLAHAVQRSVRANLAWAFAYNGIALALAAGGLLQPVLAAALMAGSSLVVVVRSLRAQRREAAGGTDVYAPAASSAARPSPAISRTSALASSRRKSKKARARLSPLSPR